MFFMKPADRDLDTLRTIMRAVALTQKAACKAIDISTTKLNMALSADQPKRGLSEGEWVRLLDHIQHAIEEFGGAHPGKRAPQQLARLGRDVAHIRQTMFRPNIRPSQPGALIAFGSIDHVILASEH